MTHDAGPTVVVAGLSARWLAASARRAGWCVVALDAFGDVDTRALALQWWPIARGLELDADLILAALARAADQHGAQAWVYGGGFENLPDLVARAAQLLPLWGQPATSLAAVRQPESFFATLQRLGLPHPPTRFDPPADAAGWWAKSARGSGGWHIREASVDEADAAPDVYWQRHQAGRPMSALYLADGREARIVAMNHLLVEPLGSCPLVYRGAIGPVVHPALEQAVAQALAALVPACGLVGLGSLDFIATADGLSVLEVNPRPSASMALHDAAWPGGLLAAHVRALHGSLPQAAKRATHVSGERVVWAERAVQVDQARAAWFARSAHLHDRPHAGACVQAGQPLCSVSASAATVDEVDQQLRSREAAVLAACGARTMQHSNEETA